MLSIIEKQNLKNSQRQLAPAYFLSICLSFCLSDTPHQPVLSCLSTGQNQHSALTLSTWLQTVESWSMCFCQRLHSSRRERDRQKEEVKEEIAFRGFKSCSLIGSYPAYRLERVGTFQVLKKCVSEIVSMKWRLRPVFETVITAN